LLACSSHGIDSHPMEGFDERRLKQIINLPDNYTIPVIVSIGYSDDDKKSQRIPPERVYSKNDFNSKMKDLQTFNE
jgi:nitroreductase